MVDYRVRGLENFGVYQPTEVAGPYDIPVIAPTTLPDLRWEGFKYVRGRPGDKQTGVHFFMDDYQFSAVWSQPERYAAKLSQFGAVLSPDFSLYIDTPKILQIWNHYRKHWLAQYWQSQGMVVIPSLAWGTQESWKWCFDGEPTGSPVAISTIGTKRDKEWQAMFEAGWHEMIRRLHPSKVLCFGGPYDFMRESCDIIEQETFVERLHRRRKGIS